jgi:uncharacterized coiled-coil protein SlyX
MNYGSSGQRDESSITDQLTTLIDTINHNTKIIEKQNKKLGFILKKLKNKEPQVTLTTLDIH